MFLTLTNVQSGEAVSLLQYIDNRSGKVQVALRSITYTVGWYNVEAGESISWRTNGTNGTVPVTPGLYSVEDLIKFIEANGVTLSVNKANGLITLLVEADREVLLTDGLLTLLGLDDGFGGQWLDSGTYTGDRPVNFATTKALHLHLEQLDTTGNVTDGAPSTLLATVGLGRHAFGDINTIRLAYPEFKCLRSGTVNELKLVVRGDDGKSLDNHGLPIYVTFELQ